jgi:hypothetical protein
MKAPSKIPKGKYKTEYTRPLLMEQLVKLMAQIERELHIKISVTIETNNPEIICSGKDFGRVIIHKGNNK